MEFSPPWVGEREIVVKDRCIASSEYGRDPYNRPIRDHLRFGVINLDKPSGPSSHEVASWVKKLIGIERSGHGGTLEAKWLRKPQSNRCSPHSS